MLGNTERSRLVTSTLKFGSLEKIRITSSEPRFKLGILEKGLIISIGLKSRTSPNKYENARYAIGNFSMKDLSNIIMEFEKLPYKKYERKRPKHEPTDSYF